jgi:hypothetical protein
MKDSINKGCNYIWERVGGQHLFWLICLQLVDFLSDVSMRIFKKIS